VLARWDLRARRSIGRFILIGEHFAHPAQLPPGMPLRADYGYDGQFYYRLANNPFNFSHTAFGITVDRTYRFMRIGYPVITWLVSAGQRALIPYMLVAVNVAAPRHWRTSAPRSPGRAGGTPRGGCCYGPGTSAWSPAFPGTPRNRWPPPSCSPGCSRFAPAAPTWPPCCSPSAH
jgi:hypothetical protein